MTSNLLNFIPSQRTVYFLSCILHTVYYYNLELTYNLFITNQKSYEIKNWMFTYLFIFCHVMAKHTVNFCACALLDAALAGMLISGDT